MRPAEPTTAPLPREECVGFIQLVFFDDRSNEAVPIGGAGFLTPDEMEAAWDNVAAFSGEGETSFMADRLDHNRDIIDDKSVTAETCEQLTGRPIAELITEGRKKLALQLAELTRHRNTHDQERVS